MDHDRMPGDPADFKRKGHYAPTSNDSVMTENHIPMKYRGFDETGGNTNNMHTIDINKRQDDQSCAYCRKHSTCCILTTIAIVLFLLIIVALAVIYASGVMKDDSAVGSYSPLSARLKGQFFILAISNLTDDMSQSVWNFDSNSTSNFTGVKEGGSMTNELHELLLDLVSKAANLTPFCTVNHCNNFNYTDVSFSNNRSINGTVTFSVTSMHPKPSLVVGYKNYTNHFSEWLARFFKQMAIDQFFLAQSFYVESNFDFETLCLSTNVSCVDAQAQLSFDPEILVNVDASNSTVVPNGFYAIGSDSKNEDDSFDMLFNASALRLLDFNSSLLANSTGTDLPSTRANLSHFKSMDDDDSSSVEDFNVGEMFDQSFSTTIGARIPNRAVPVITNNASEPQMPRCVARDFLCANLKQVVPSYNQCDGKFDCLDGSDELNCRGCKTSFSCRSTTNGTMCLRGSNLCDGRVHCEDEQDEKRFCRSQCRRHEYKCKDSNICLSQRFLCDGDPHCPNGDDELNCTMDTCQNHAIWCSFTRNCLAWYSWCDGTAKCVMS